MKKHTSILVTLVLGISFNSFAGTGGPADGLQFFLVIIGSMLLILGLISGGDYLRKNGRRWIKNAVIITKKKINSLITYLRKLKADFLELSWV